MNVEWVPVIVVVGGAASVKSVTVRNPENNKQITLVVGGCYSVDKPIPTLDLRRGEKVVINELLIPGFTQRFVGVKRLRGIRTEMVGHDHFPGLLSEPEITVEDHSRKLAEPGYAVNGV